MSAAEKRVRVKPLTDLLSLDSPQTVNGKTGVLITQKRVGCGLPPVAKVRLDDGRLITLSFRYLEEL